jgi:UDP-glucose:(heptosyl)LPS alpha-1,3-glucosyltransferase
MKLALVHLRHAGTGGTERYLNQLASHLAATGHDVTIVCRRHEAAPHPAVRFVVLHGFALGGAWRVWRFAREVERHVRETPYDLVMGLGRSVGHDVVRLGGGCHASYLELAHAAAGSGWERWIGPAPKHRLALELERRALAPGAYRRVVVNSQMVKRDVMTRYGVPEAALRVIYNGVDLERFHPRRREGEGRRLRRELGLEEGHAVALFLGTGYARKGLDRTLRAFAAAAAARPELRLLVVGYDSGRAAFEREATRLGVGSRVRFLGGRRDVEACYAAADLYVLPTRYDPFASSTLEALASGLPVLTTTTNGASELLSPAEGSVLPNDDDPAELSTALLRWSEPGRARKAAGDARALAERHPEARTVTESAALLEEVVAEKRAEGAAR